MDFGRILAKFLEGFDLTMIRATKGKSMDGWMAGWMKGREGTGSTGTTFCRTRQWNRHKDEGREK